MNQISTLSVFDTDVHLDGEGRFSLNDIHRAAIAKGLATTSQRPGSFLKNKDVQAFIGQVGTSATRVAPVKKVNGGANPGSYAVRILALRYSAWLDKRVEAEVFHVFDAYISGDESLTADMIDRQQDPEASKRLAVRAQGKVARNALTSTLAAHGVTGRGFADCTNAIYSPILGGPASLVRASRQLKPKANLREHMTGKELAAVMLSEEIARERIDQTRANGNEPCAIECNTAARRVRSIL